MACRSSRRISADPRRRCHPPRSAPNVTMRRTTGGVLIHHVCGRRSCGAHRRDLGVWFAAGQVIGLLSVGVSDRLVPEGAWRLRRAKSLIKLLALSPAHRAHRWRAAELLWPDRDLDVAVRNLTQVTYIARRALDVVDDNRGRCLVLRDEMLALECRLEIDVEVFEAAAAAAAGGDDVEVCHRALDLYGGELLPEDRFEAWTGARRDSIREAYLGLLVRVAELQADDLAAIEAFERAVVEDPLHEAAHRGLMRRFVAVGRQQQALAQYQRLRRALRVELAAEPDPQTRRLYLEILGGQADPVTATPVKGLTPPAPVAARRAPALPHQLTSFVGRERELREVAAAAGRRTPAHADRRRRLRQDPPGAATSPPGCAARYAGRRLARRAGAARRPGARRAGRRWPRSASRDAPRPAAAGRAGRPPASAAAAAGAGQLRAPDRRLRALADALLRACPRRARPGDQPRAARRRRRGRPGACPRCPCPAGDATSPPMLPACDGGAAVRRARRRPRAGLRRRPPRTRPPSPQICRRLDGIPLAHRAGRRAGARAARRRRSPRASTTASGLLTGGSRHALPAPADAAGDSSTGATTCSTEPERALFRRLAVFAGGFTLEAAEAVCDGDAVRSATCWPGWSTSRCARSSRAAHEPATGCSRRSASTPWSGSATPARRAASPPRHRAVLSRAGRCGDANATGESGPPGRLEPDTTTCEQRSPPPSRTPRPPCGSPLRCPGSGRLAGTSPRARGGRRPRFEPTRSRQPCAPVPSSHWQDSTHASAAETVAS